MREIGVWFPVWTDLTKSLKYVVTAPLPNARQQVWVSRVLREEWSRVTVAVARWRTVTARWSWVPSIGQICSPSSVMVTSPNDWKILEWDEKPTTNKKFTHRCYALSSCNRVSKVWFILHYIYTICLLLFLLVIFMTVKRQLTLREERVSFVRIRFSSFCFNNKIIMFH